MNNPTLTKNEAIAAAKRGEKITHTSFSPSEWFTIEKGMYIFEDGCKCSAGDFWYYRASPPWFDGYSIFSFKTQV